MTNLKLLDADSAVAAIAAMSRDDLSAAYVEIVGYCPFADDPSMSDDDVADMLADTLILMRTGCLRIRHR
jgi:hypothetical protein